jgi:3-methyladenine DNA glycosylase AlkD
VIGAARLPLPSWAQDLIFGILLSLPDAIINQDLRTNPYLRCCRWGDHRTDCGQVGGVTFDLFLRLMQMDISQRLSSIKQALVAKSDEKAKGAFRKFIPTSQHVYGVRVPLLNQLAKEHREGAFELAEVLWRSGAFEEKLLGAKLLGRSCKKDPDRALKLAKEFSGQITDWAVCDTLGMQGVKGITLKKWTELFAWSNKLVKSKNLWKRRLALVLLTHFVKDKDSRAQIEETLARVRGDKEHYVKKAVEWLQRDLRQ